MIEEQFQEIVRECDIEDDDDSVVFDTLRRVLTETYRKGQKDMGAALAKSNQQVLDLLFEIDRLKKGQDL